MGWFSNAVSWCSDRISDAGDAISSAASSVGNWATRRVEGIQEMWDGRHSNAVVQQSQATSREINERATAGNDVGLINNTQELITSRITILEGRGAEANAAEIANLRATSEALTTAQTQLAANPQGGSLDRPTGQNNQDGTPQTAREAIRQFAILTNSQNSTARIGEVTGNMQAAAATVETTMIVSATIVAVVATGGLAAGPAGAALVGAGTSAAMSQTVGIIDQAGGLGEHAQGRDSRNGGLIARAVTGNLTGQESAGNLTSLVVSDALDFIPLRAGSAAAPAVRAAGREAVREGTEVVVAQATRSVLNQAARTAGNEVISAGISQGRSAIIGLGTNAADDLLTSTLGTNQVATILAGQAPGAAPTTVAPTEGNTLLTLNTPSGNTPSGNTPATNTPSTVVTAGGIADVFEAARRQERARMQGSDNLVALQSSATQATSIAAPTTAGQGNTGRASGIA